MNEIVRMLSYHFMQRALLVGVLVSLCAALLGVSLVLKRYSMIGDGLSHVGFGALAVASALHLAPLAVAVPVVILAAVLLLRLSESKKIKGDAAIALISSSALAIGVISVSVTTGMNTEVSSYMFGSILSLSRTDTVLSAILSVCVLALFLAFYPRLFAVTFDESFAKATGTPVSTYNLLIAVTIAVIIVLAMNLVGSLLISALIIFPAVSAMRLFRSFKGVTVCSAILSVSCALIGMLVSILGSTPVGSTIVAVDIAAFLVFSLLARLGVNRRKA